MSQGKGVTWRSLRLALLVTALLTFIVLPLLTEAIGRIEALILSVGLFFTALLIIERHERGA
ncbi:MAG: hypothetical protein ACE5KH_04175 [Candidatus Geothermarchaeales archaeon]